MTVCKKPFFWMVSVHHLPPASWLARSSGWYWQSSQEGKWACLFRDQHDSIAQKWDGPVIRAVTPLTVLTLASVTSAGGSVHGPRAPGIASNHVRGPDWAFLAAASRVW